MERLRIDSLEVNLKSAFRNLKSEILTVAMLFALCALLFALCAPAQAQQSTKMPRIGYLTAASQPGMAPRTDAFRQGLRDLGYVEGKNIVIEWRYAGGKADQIPALVAELIALKVDLIVSAGPGVTRVAKQATSTIPIVMAFDNDPVGNGFVASLARPGGTITGLSTVEPELNGKRLDLLKEIIPRLSRASPTSARQPTRASRRH
jgi:putative tryptophan/tyrosine transport system substrate-binding protein